MYIVANLSLVRSELEWPSCRILQLRTLENATAIGSRFIFDCKASRLISTPMRTPVFVAGRVIRNGSGKYGASVTRILKKEMKRVG